ncbi:A disintegrin and metalloproteinase with thrombospondin motifs 1 [Xylocopa sonorina]|uniref:A disintegrin and metalloproteinase with thrombospondin motifs 1 n=1 Tax=Xylocopa sonorina TaxID=1818115 RepID=UPI00403AE51A
MAFIIVILWACVKTTKQEIEKEVDGGRDRVAEDLGSFRVERLDRPSSVTGNVAFDRNGISDEVTPKSEKRPKKQNEFRKSEPPPPTADLEYIRLAKTSENQYEDPQNRFSTVTRHDSGHFRLPTAETWDSHPRYEFTAFGRRFRFLLAHDTSFVSPSIKITHMSKDVVRRVHPGHELDCFYSGIVDGDPRSAVTVSLCQGMTGHVRTSTGSYIIKPTEPCQDSDKDSVKFPMEHAIERITPSTMHRGRTNDIDDRGATPQSCGVIDRKMASIADDSSMNEIYTEDRRRERRSVNEEKALDNSQNEEEFQQFVRQSDRHRTFLHSDSMYDRYYSVEQRQNDPGEEYGQDSEMESDPSVTWRPQRTMPSGYFIEIVVVADATMIKYHRNSLISYILVLMNMVSSLYKDYTVGNPINISVVKIVPIDQVFGQIYYNGTGNEVGRNATDVLKMFCKWQNNDSNKKLWGHYDTSVLLTRETLCDNARTCVTLGLAELGAMCNPQSSCAIVQDSGLATAFTIAHEIGHVLNMPHDEPEYCSRFREDQKLMSRMLDNNSSPFEWSECSRHYVTEFLETGRGRCLLDKPDSIIDIEGKRRYPGEDYSVNRQCNLVFGNESRRCISPNPTSDVCKQLWCFTSAGCVTHHMPWADGTPCDNGKWCYHGKCVPRRKPKPVDGQWGEWGPYGECTRTCGGGVKKKYRKCNNPRPQHGGYHCFGNRVEYSSCNTRECPPGTRDFRDVQCSYYDNNNFNIPELSRNVKWHAEYKIDPQERCKLYCESDNKRPYKLREKVIDGTPCGKDTFHICVNGLCKPAGCDHVLGSTAKLDMCEVCKGDNSTCQWITGLYNNSGQYGYTRVAKIPAGSNHINIQQQSWIGIENDKNYLALRDAENGMYIINGDFMLMNEKKIVVLGVTINYSGHMNVTEYLNISEPIKTDLILEILSVGNYPPQLTYRHTVPKTILRNYAWKLSNWSNCNPICRGMKYRKAECRDIEYNDIVSDDYCRESDKPREESQMCNNHCILEWNTTFSECSNHCGPGTRNSTSRCLQRHSLHPPREILSQFCNHLPRPNSSEPCWGPCENAHWSYEKWGPCDVPCGRGLQHRTAVCVDSKRRQITEENCIGKTKVLTRECRLEPCPSWAFRDWSHCSVTCGIGQHQKLYVCTIENRIVENIYCSDPPPIVVQSCDAGPCVQWDVGDWSSCSVTCNNGIKQRKVICKTTDGKTSNKCSLSNKPKNITVCKLKPCPTTRVTPTYSQENNEVPNIIIDFGYKWHIQTQQCSRPCIKGNMYVTAKCYSKTGEIVSDSYCRRKKKPTKVPCNHHCPKWVAGKWTRCSKSCGTGVQRRRVVCKIRRNHKLDITVKDEDCTRFGLEKPISQKYCRRVACRFIWQEGPWSECSAECGDGIQHRSVTCHRTNRYGLIDSTPTNNNSCPMDRKPSTKQSCKLRECNDEYYWVPGAWSKCSHICGKRGHQVRKVYCRDMKRKRLVNVSFCSREERPPRKQKCNRRKCYAMSCLDAKRYYRTTKDDEYMLVVGGRNMSIYCHGMWSSEPKEYLTLPSGPRENYAEVYHNTLHNPCPYNEPRNENCNCNRSGKTEFRRIRIDPLDLYIIENDYTFSRTTGANRVEYGVAGDCNSVAGCPQGRFSINLSGTQFKLSSKVDWKKTYRSSININRINSQHISGKCGGYCGYCEPKNGLKLDVLPP